MAFPLRSPQLSTFSMAKETTEHPRRGSYVISHRPPTTRSFTNPLPPLPSPQQPFIPEAHPEPPSASKYRTEIPKTNPIVSAYLSVSWWFGFREKYSLIWMFICGGALLGFCLARSLLMEPVKMRKLTAPGEFFWFEMPLYKWNYIIHIFLSIIGGILAGAQFVPAIRRRYVLFHRINGYIVFITVFIANITGGIVARRSFGGELNSQSVYYISGLMSNVALVWAIANVKRNTRSHRKWMLRAVVYFSVVISAKTMSQAAQAIVTDLGSYYSIWRCDEILFVLKDIPKLLQTFPECSTSPLSLTNPHLYTAVHASSHEGKLGKASAIRATQGMVLWIATLLHVIGVEIYLRSTDDANYKRHGYALEPKDFDPDRDLFSVRY